MIKLIEKYLEGFVSESDVAEMYPRVVESVRKLSDRTGAGNEWLGWIDLPVNYDQEEFERIKKTAERIRSDTDVLIVIGIGGSYLGARAVIEATESQSYNVLPKDTPDVYFAGNSLSAIELENVLKICEGKRVSLNVISKSGTTLEPAIVFRVLGDMMRDRYGDEATNRIYVTTGGGESALKKLADECGYESFSVPENIGGRYSVLTAVGLLPIAVAGIDIDALMDGAAQAKNELTSADDIASRYALIRNILSEKGYGTEIMVNYEPSMAAFNEWWKQLFGESEGKDGRGIFPASVVFSTDLHSMGQYIQDGPRDLFETVVKFTTLGRDVVIPNGDDGDGLGYLAGKSLHYVNQTALEATVMAHYEGGVPNVLIELPELTEKSIGYLLYFFERACAISGYVLGVNPFDQPGVEGYKKKMFELLER